MQNEFSEVLEKVVSLFNDAGIRYCIGGSVASGIRSQFRATLDIDILAEFSDNHAIHDFCKKAEGDFYVYEDAATVALASGKSFNIIHKKLFLKVDIFTSKDEFSSVQLKRATVVRIPNTKFEVKVATTEDMIINKLAWYKLGGCQSERQWNDLLTLVSYNQQNIEIEYLKTWSRFKNVEELLGRLFNSKLY